MGFKRSEWNTLIQQVNAKITACGGSIPPLGEVGVNHRWSVSDILSVQDTLMDLCTNADFGIIPLRWKQSTINRLQEAIDACDCCGWEMYELPYTWGLLSESCDISGLPATCYYLNLAGQVCGASGYRYRVGRIRYGVWGHYPGGPSFFQSSVAWTILTDAGIANEAIPNKLIYDHSGGPDHFTIDSIDATNLLIASAREFCDTYDGCNQYSVYELPSGLWCFDYPYQNLYYGVEIRPDVICV